MKPVTDPNILAQLNAGAPAGPRPVTDPALLAQLDAPAPPATAPYEPDMIETVLRKLQLPGRAVIEGVQDIGQMAQLSNPAGLTQALMQLGTDAPPDPRIADMIGMVQPETAGERVFDAAGRAVTGGVLTGGAGLIPAIGAATGGAAGQITKESGGGMGAQLLASLLGGLTPQGAVGASNALRATLVNQPAAAARIAASEAAGAGVPTVAQATDNPIAGIIESLAARWPGSSAPMAAKSAAQTEGMSATAMGSADDLVRSLTDTPTREAAGRAVIGAVEKGFAPTTRARANELYSARDKLIPEEFPVPVAKVRAFLEDAAKPIDESVEGAKELNAALVANPEIIALRGAIEAATKNGGSIPYSALKQVQSKIGRAIEDAGLADKFPRKQMRALYATIGSDISESLASNPAGKRAAMNADKYYATRADTLESLAPIIEKQGGPSKVYNAIITGGVKRNEGVEMLRKVMSATRGNPDAQKALAGTVLKEMGKTPEEFVKRYTAMPAANKALFDRLGPEFRADLDKVVKGMERTVSANAKRAADAPGESVKNLRSTAAGATAMALVTGHLFTAGLAAASAGAARGTAGIMTNPKFVKWLARQDKVPAGGLSSSLGALAAQNPDDEDIQAFVSELRDGAAPASE